MKQRCAREALKLIKNNMTIGLGGGSTISYLVGYIKEAQLDVKVVTPSLSTAQSCIKNGLHLLPTWAVDHLDIAFDGCDEVDLKLNALKSGGAIHTKEKIIASMADDYVLLVDESKVFEQLPLNLPIALEVFPEALSYVTKKLNNMNALVEIRPTSSKDGGTISDNGNYILNAKFEKVEDLKKLNDDLLAICGVIDTSLFYNIATKVISVDQEGSRVIVKEEAVKMQKYNWGILGTGWIAHEMGDALKRVHDEIYAVCDVTIEGAKKYQEEYDVVKAYGNVDEMLDDENVDIVYIATPHNLHYEMMIKALNKGKHVFCEKAITVNDRQLEEAVAIAKEKNLIISDGTTLLHMPLYRKVKEIITSGKLGKVKMIQVNFGSCKEYDVKNRFFAKELAGGALLDIGVYAVSFARYFMTSKPNVVLTTANYFETGVDETSGIVLKNPDEEMAVISLTMRAKQPKRGMIALEEGYIEIYNFPRGNKATITYTVDGHSEVIELGDTDLALDYEVNDMERYITENDGKENLTYVRDVMATLTAIRNQWGMVYPFE